MQGLLAFGLPLFVSLGISVSAFAEHAGHSHGSSYEPRDSNDNVTSIRDSQSRRYEAPPQFGVAKKGRGFYVTAHVDYRSGNRPGYRSEYRADPYYYRGSPYLDSYYPWSNYYLPQSSSYARYPNLNVSAQFVGPLGGRWSFDYNRYSSGGFSLSTRTPFSQYSLGVSRYW